MTLAVLVIFIGPLQLAIASLPLSTAWLALSKPHPSLTLDQNQQEVSQKVTIQKHRGCKYGAPTLPLSVHSLLKGWEVLGSAHGVGELD